MSSQSKLKSSLKLPGDKLCAKYLKKHVRFDFSDIYHELELLERNEKRSKCLNKLLQSEHLKTSRAILHQTEIRLAIRYLEKKYKKFWFHKVSAPRLCVHHSGWQKLRVLEISLDSVDETWWVGIPVKWPRKLQCTKSYHKTLSPAVTENCSLKWTKILKRMLLFWKTQNWMKSTLHPELLRFMKLKIETQHPAGANVYLSW